MAIRIWNHQVSDNISLGFEVTPPGVPGLFISTTFNRTDFTDKIGSLWSALGYPGTFALENASLFPGLVERNSEGILTLLSNQDGNLSGVLNESLDVQMLYTFSTSYGDFSAGMLATRNFTQEETAAPGVDPIARQGTHLGPPKLRGNVYLDWDWRNWQAGATLNYSSDYENTDEQAISRDVSSYTTLDVHTTYHLGDTGWRFRLAIDNILDKDFPFVDNFQGVDSSRVDFRRRVVVLEAHKEFAW